MTEMKEFEARIIEKKVVAKGTFLMKFDPECSFLPKPGQFIMISPRETGHFLKRPISIHYFYKDSGYFKILFRVMGSGTAELSDLRFGDTVSVIGPLGNGFDLPDKGGSAAIIAGGIGYAPFAYLISELNLLGIRPHVFYGEKSKDQLVEYWRHSGADFTVSTDDGSYGRQGSITRHFSGTYDSIYICGPLGMVFDFKRRFALFSSITQASMEAHMACGVGSCKGCNIETAAGVRYVCSDGPVFALDELIDQNS